MTAVAAATNPTEAVDFLERLHDGETGYLSLFAVDRRDGSNHVAWCELPDVTAIVKRATQLASTHCVWVGVAPRQKILPGTLRGRASDCVTIPCLWVDIDIAGEGHAADDLPPDMDAAFTLLRSYPLPPTVIVDTGGGIQAYWQFLEPLPVDEASELTSRWGATWSRYASEHGWGIDNVWDIPRVLRLPGTLNNKTANPRPVRVIDANWDRRFGIDDLDQWLIDPPKAPQQRNNSDIPWIGPPRPGDAFNASVDPAALIERVGCTLHSTSGGDRHYRAPHRTAPGDTSGITIYADGHTTIYSETFARQYGLETRRPYDPFGLYTHLFHRGNWRAATNALVDLGYGERPVDLADLIAPDEPTSGNTPATSDEYDAELLGMLIDWHEFASTDHRAEEWLWEPVLPAHRAVAIWAKGGTGKSLVTLRLVLDLVLAGHRVLYLDYEMTPDDLDDRLSEMGIDDPTTLSGLLHYALLPSLPAFDTPEGGKAVRRMAELVDAELVIIDTFARAVQGDENDADTVRNFYRMTGLHLKADGRAFVRVDHAGKDGTKGQRGTSAKNDDVDLVWELRRAEGGYDLVRGKCRMGWVPEKVHLELVSSPMRLKAAGGDSYPTGTGELASLLDDLGIPLDAGVRKAMTILREHGQGRNQEKVRAALKYRRNRSSMRFLVDDRTTNNTALEAVENAGHAVGHAAAETARTRDLDTRDTEPQNTRSTPLGHASGHARTHPPDAGRTQRVSPKGDTRVQRDPEPIDTGLI